MPVQPLTPPPRLPVDEVAGLFPLRQRVYDEINADRLLHEGQRARIITPEHGRAGTGCARMNDYQPIAHLRQATGQRPADRVVNHPLPVDVQITLGTAACFLREVERDAAGSARRRSRKGGFQRMTSNLPPLRRPRQRRRSHNDAAPLHP